MKMILKSIYLPVIALGFCAVSQAATITIVNGNFSSAAGSPSFNPNSWVVAETNTGNNLETIYVASMGGTQANVLHFKDTVGDATSNYIQQTVSGAINPGVFADTYSSYTLTLDLGWRTDTDRNDVSYRFSLFNVTDNVELAFVDVSFPVRATAGNNVYALIQDDASFTLSYDNTISSYAGDAIALRLARTDADTTDNLVANTNAFSTTWIDDVRLTAVPEPSVALLGGLGLLGLLRRRR